MSEERQNQSGERRLERIRAELGMPVRRAPIAVGALVGGALGAWMAGVPAQLLVTVRDGIAASASVAALDGAGSVRSLMLQVAAVAWPALALDGDVQPCPDAMLLLPFVHVKCEEPTAAW
jgi:hypothetical protein